MSDVLLGGTVSAGGSPFPIVRDTELYGGMRVVADITARDAIITADLKAGMLVCVVSDTVPYTIYQLKATSPVAWVNIFEPSMMAGGDPAQNIYLTWDPVGGSDSTAAITFGAPDWSKAVATPAGIANLIPKFGAGRNFILCPKPKASLASYALASTLDLTRPRGYGKFIVRGSNAGAADTADRTIAGGQVATGTSATGYNPTTVFPMTITGATNASPIEITTSANHGLSDRMNVNIANVVGNTAANGNWTITVSAANKFVLQTPGSAGESTGNGAYTSGGTVTSRSSFAFQIAGGGAPSLSADPAFAMYRIRFDAATATSALRNVCRTIQMHGTAFAILGQDLPADFTTSDTFYIEQPGVVLGNSITLGPIADVISIAGIDCTTIVQSAPLANLNIAFSRMSGLVNFSDTVDLLRSDTFYVDESAASITVGGNRMPGGFIASRSGFVIEQHTYVDTFHRFFDCLAWAIGAGCRSRTLAVMVGCGAGTLEVGAASSSQSRRVGNSGSTTVRRFLMDSGDNRFILQGSNVEFLGVDFSVVSGSVGGITPLGKSVFTVDGVVGNRSPTGAVIDMTGGVDCTVSIGTITANYAGGSTGHIAWCQGGAPAYSDWTDATVTEVIDGKKNRVFGTKGLSIGSSFDMPASAVSKFRVVRQQSGGVVVHAKADTVANASRVIGVAINSQAGSGNLASVAQSGVIPIVFDSLPALGDDAYLSTANAGQAQNTVPAASGTNQRFRLGTVVGAVTYAGLSIGYVQWNPDGASITAGSSYQLNQGGALAVLGRSANSAGTYADIQATASSDAVLRESGSTIGWGTIATGGIAANAVTYAKVQQGAARTVLGVAGTATANYAEISTTSGSNACLRENGSGTIGWGTLAIAGGGTGQVTAPLAFAALSPVTTKGDLLGFDTANNRIPIGSNNQVLIADSAQALGLKWATVSIASGGTGQITASAAFDALSPNTTKGDLTVRGASSNVNLAVGSNGQVLMADSTATNGVKWAAATATGLSPWETYISRAQLFISYAKPKVIYDAFQNAGVWNFGSTIAATGTWSSSNSYPTCAILLTAASNNSQCLARYALSTSFGTPYLPCGSTAKFYIRVRMAATAAVDSGTNLGLATSGAGLQIGVLGPSSTTFFTAKLNGGSAGTLTSTVGFDTNMHTHEFWLLGDGSCRYAVDGETPRTSTSYPTGTHDYFYFLAQNLAGSASTIHGCAFSEVFMYIESPL